MTTFSNRTTETGPVPDGRIKKLRRAIDDIDDRLLALINERLALAAQIGSLKQVAGSPTKDREREKHIIKRLKSLNSGPIDNQLLSRVFVDIIRASCHLQNTIRRDSGDPRHGTERDSHG